MLQTVSKNRKIYYTHILKKSTIRLSFDPVKITSLCFFLLLLLFFVCLFFHSGENERLIWDRLDVVILKVKLSQATVDGTAAQLSNL